MKEETKAKIAEWAEKTGQSIEELTEQFNANVAAFKKSITAKDEDWYEDAALRRLYVTVKAEILSPARPFDYISLGYTSTMDISRTDREEKLALYHNPETRAQAIAEGKVGIIDGVPTPMDTREWMVAPDPSKGVKGFKNRNFGKPLEPTIIRTLVNYGRPSKGGDFKLLSVLATQELTKRLPPLKKALRSRFNLRDDSTYHYVCNASRLMKFDAIQLPEYPEIDEKVICDILSKAPLYDPATSPSGIRVPLGLLRQWHDANIDNIRRLCILVGDVTAKPPEPVSTGNYIVVIEDATDMELEHEGTPIWVPGELEEFLDFAPGSRVIVVGRTNIGPGRNPDTGQFDASIERVQINAAAIFAIPEWRIPPERLVEM